MNHEHEHEHEHDSSPGNNRWKYVFIGFALIAGYFLVTEHQAHVVPYLPFLLILACPLLHLFHGHGGHGGSSAGNERRGDKAAQGPAGSDAPSQQSHTH